MIKTATVKDILHFMQAVAKINPDTPVYLSCDEEGNSYSTVEPWHNEGFSSFSVQFSEDNKIVSVVIFPWKEGLTDEEVGFIINDKKEENETKI